MNTPDQHSDKPDIDGTAQDRLRASRRSAILSGLGKGSVALAALSPLASQAISVRSHKLANGTLQGGFGYCTISGFQSAAVSGSPAPTVCSAFAPSHFLTVETLTYVGGIVGNGGGNADTKLKNALNTKYGVGVFNESNVAPLLATVAPTSGYVAVPGSGVVLIWTSNNTSTALTRSNWPASGVDGLAAFNASPRFTGSTDDRPLLRVLYDGVLSANPATANCWFLSAYLTVYTTTPSGLPVGFDTSYLTGAYASDASAASGSDAYQFLKALCTTP